MATIHGIAFPDHVAPLVRHMPAVNDLREALAALSGTWDTLALLAHLSNLKADMREVRRGFGELAEELLGCLAEELLRLAQERLAHQARMATELLARDPAVVDAQALQRAAPRVFARIAADDEVLAIVDAQRSVVVSSDPARLPPGRLLAPRAGAASLRLGGVTHLVAQHAGRWTAVALAPVELAFGEPAQVATPVGWSGETVLPPRLLDVPVRAREIQRRLDRLVWNGRLHQAAEPNAFSRSLLEEIAANGRKTRDVFERACDDLIATVAAGLLDEARLLSGFAVQLQACGNDDATPLQARLRDALPARPGAVAAWCGHDGRVVARTGELPVTLPASVLSLAPGDSWSGVLAEGAERFIVGATAGPEESAAIGVVVIPCGHAVDRHVGAAPQIANVDGGTEIATFMIGEHLLGVPAIEVVECIEVAAAVRVWRGGFAQRHVGFVTWNDAALPLVDIADALGVTGATQRHALVLRAGEQAFGLLVSELGPVADMQLTEERGLAGQGPMARLISQLARSGAVFIPVLVPDAIFGVTR